MLKLNIETLKKEIADHELCLFGICKVLDEHGVDDMINFALLSSWQDFKGAIDDHTRVVKR